ncbi:phosphodiesterase [Desulfoluna limicola]|uniref:Phosphodiesterase n=2 Tax=Desulfoluna limicola TaxID=2810562 RepID=A0ABM7PN82_9BACT|nr:phosphodiesterase [Desulfoluna limicola]
MNNFAQLQIDLRQMIIAIETAVSLVGMNDTNHGKRVGYIAGQLGHQLGFSEQDIQFSFDLGLLHDCGVSTEQMHANLVNHFDWKDAYVHCNIGYKLLRDFEPLSAFATPILHHHTPWEELQGLEVSRQDALMANLIFLSDRIDVMAASHYETDILLARQEIASSITNYAGAYFDPSLVSAFQQIEKSEAFWIALENRHITRYTWDMGNFKTSSPLSISQLKQLALIMAYIVDQKSPFTAQHSIRVADLARHLASLLGLPDEQCEKIEIAGLLHDLGKLHTPDKILEKPGPLNDIERTIINQHSYETYEILRHIEGLDEIARWAAFHHECLNGVGYPFHPNEKDLSIEARILAVADIFQALVQDRPYRAGMPLSKVLGILDEFTRNEKLDKEIVTITREHGDACFEIAKGHTITNNQSNLLLFSMDDDISSRQRATPETNT